jgi:hypothetical protein
MTANDFRKLALGFPETLENSHMGHPDFRVRNRIFASLGWPDEVSGMVKLTPQEQATFIQADSAAFYPASGAWGRHGSTMVRLRKAKKSLVREAILAAWRNTAPKSLSQQLDDD